VGQGQAARRIHEHGRAVQLQVDDGPPAVLHRVQPAEPVQRRAKVQGVGRQQPQKARVPGRLLADQRAQRRRQPGLAGDGPQVKEDAGLEQVLRLAVRHPAAEGRCPFRNGLRAGGLARHDAALAQRETAGVQHLVGVAGHDEPAFALGRADLVIQHQAVVLVGGDGLLAAPLGAKGHPAGAGQVQPVLRRQQDQHAFHQGVVELADQVGQRAGGQPLSQQLPRQGRNLRGQRLQRGQVRRAAQRAAQLAQGSTLQREQVALGHQADHPAALGQGHVADAVARHQRSGLLQWLFDVQCVHGRTHHRPQRGASGVQRRLGQHHAGQEIVPGEDAQRHALRIQGQHGPHAVRVHQAQGLVQGGVGRDGHGRAAQQRGQGLLKALLRQRMRPQGGRRVILVGRCCPRLSFHGRHSPSAVDRTGAAQGLGRRGDLSPGHSPRYSAGYSTNGGARQQGCRRRPRPTRPARGRRGKRGQLQRHHRRPPARADLHATRADLLQHAGAIHRAAHPEGARRLAVHGQRGPARTAPTACGDDAQQLESALLRHGQGRLGFGGGRGRVRPQQPAQVRAHHGGHGGRLGVGRRFGRASGQMQAPEDRGTGHCSPDEESRCFRQHRGIMMDRPHSEPYKAP